jgi:putative RNA 2'-phosphotransferase
MAVDAVRRCDAHGLVAGEACPDCGATGRVVVDGDCRRRLSRFCSGALRHFPGEVGLELDGAGWTALGDLVAAATARYDWADRAAVAGVVATDPKGRYERRGDRVRAAYGHSVDVTLSPTDAAVPDRLYHGTDPDALDAILAEGLRPMGRQSVHLAASPADARTVGSRHAADPAVLAVDAAAMRADGRRVDRRGADTYTTAAVPPRYLSVVDAP